MCKWCSWLETDVTGTGSIKDLQTDSCLAVGGECVWTYGTIQSSEECKILSYFGKKCSTMYPPKYQKRVNINTVQEYNTIVAEAVESVISDKKKVQKQKRWDFVNRKHFVILRLWIQTVKLNYTGLAVLTCKI